MFRIYGFNLILLPVNVSGVVKSIGQAIGGQKIAFARTPKVRNRTTAAISFVLVPYVIIAVLALHDLARRPRGSGTRTPAYAAVNAVLCLYAVVAFIGIRHSLVDVWSNVVQRVWRPVEPAKASDVKELDWVTVLYDGAQTGAVDRCCRPPRPCARRMRARSARATRLASRRPHGRRSLWPSP